MTKDNSISLCKGIAIICMVAGHSWINSPIEKGTRLFDMTMFFLLSGYCFKEKYLTNFSSFLIKRAKGLWIPYVKWGIISVLVHNTFLQLGVYSVDSESNPINYLYDLPVCTIGYFPSILEFAETGWWVLYTITGVIIPNIDKNLFQ